MEQIVSFLNDSNRTHNQFNIEITGITYPDSHYAVERKKSAIYCMEYIISGEGTIHVDNEVFYPSKGDIYILPLGRHHRYYSSQHNPWEKIWMNVNGTLCDMLFQVYNLEGVIWVKDLNLYDLFKKFLSICEQKDASTNHILLQSSLVFHEIIATISMHISDLPMTKNMAAYRLKEYIDHNIYDKFTIIKLTEIASLSPSQLTRVFKKEFSSTPYEYILTQKIRTAKLLLANTNLSIKQIAYKLNFADEHYFSNCFKSRSGVSPKEYKNMIIN